VRSFLAHHGISRLAPVLGAIYLACGSQAPGWPIALVGAGAVSPDIALRAAAIGWLPDDRTTPITLVAIDEATDSAWGNPALTPRAELVQLMDRVTQRRAAALVVDVDLSWGTATGDSVGEPELAAFIATHDSPTQVILPKRLIVDADGARRLAASPLDSLVAAHPQVRWAHANFMVEGSGSVRRWSDRLAICESEGPTWLPSVASAVAGDALPVSPASCTESHDPTDLPMLVGPPLSAAGAHGLGASARVISASAVLDTLVARDDDAFFADRVVLIGLTHATSGDNWMTPAGPRPGVELLAATVQFAPFQPAVGIGPEVVRRLIGIVLFGLFIWLAAHLRGAIPTVVALVVLVVVLTRVALGSFGWLGFVESLEAAVLLTIWYEALRALAELITDVRRGRATHADSRRRTWRALKEAVWQSPQAEERS
jgi:CHASE2 domain-containing sensor protein